MKSGKIILIMLFKKLCGTCYRVSSMFHISNNENFKRVYGVVL
jgi:hypothetical protein